MIPYHNYKYYKHRLRRTGARATCRGRAINGARLNPLFCSPRCLNSSFVGLTCSRYMSVCYSARLCSSVCSVLLRFAAFMMLTVCF